MSALQSQLPRSFGRYELLRRLGAGGMGTVYIALQRTDLAGERLCVVKTIKHAASELDSRFLDEARTSLQLRHRNICVTYDVILEDGATAIAMELIAGRDLKKIWSCGPVATEVVAALGCFVLDGLSYAHSLRDQRTGAALHLVHRDLSPHNIMVSFEGEVKIIDFGVAASSLKTSETAIGSFVGKIRYAAPEQLLGTGIDGRTDAYVLALVLAELASGARYYGEASEDAVLDIVGRGAAFESPTLRDMDARLRAVLESALDRDPQERVSVQDMRNALMRVAGGEPSVQRMRAWLNDLFPGAAASHDALVRSLLVGDATSVASASTSASGRVDAGAATVVGRAPSARRGSAERSSSRASPTSPTDAGRARARPEHASPRADALQANAATVVALAPEDPTTATRAGLDAGRASDDTASLMVPPSMQSLSQSSSQSSPSRRARRAPTTEDAAEGAAEDASLSEAPSRAPRILAAALGIVLACVVMVVGYVAIGPTYFDGRTHVDTPQLDAQKVDAQQVDAQQVDAQQVDAIAPTDTVIVEANDAGVLANVEATDAGALAALAASVDAGDASATSVDAGSVVRGRPKQQARKELPARPTLTGQKVRYLETHCAKLSCKKRLMAAATDLAAKPHDDVRAFALELDRCLDLCGAPP